MLTSFYIYLNVLLLAGAQEFKRFMFPENMVAVPPVNIGLFFNIASII